MVIGVHYAAWQVPNITAREHQKDNIRDIRRVFSRREHSEARRTWEEHTGESKERKDFSKSFKEKIRHGEERGGDTGREAVGSKGRATNEASPANKNVEIFEGLWTKTKLKERVNKDYVE